MLSSPLPTASGPAMPLTGPHLTPPLHPPSLLGLPSQPTLPSCLPTSPPPCLAALVLLIFRWFFMYVAAAYLRSHYRNTEVMLGQLSDFTVGSAGCHCCNKGETACRKLVCDRAVIAQCMRTWYGSVEAFEDTVKTQVKTMLYRQLLRHRVGDL